MNQSSHAMIAQILDPRPAPELPSQVPVPVPFSIADILHPRGPRPVEPRAPVAA